MSRNHFVYCVSNRDTDVIYVGRTRHPERRWKKHRWQKPEMVAQAHSFRMIGPYERDGAGWVEKHLIHQHQPPFNSQGKGFSSCPCGCEGEELSARAIAAAKRARVSSS